MISLKLPSYSCDLLKFILRKTEQFEMLKHSTPELQEASLMLFNLLSQSGCFFLNLPPEHMFDPEN